MTKVELQSWQAIQQEVMRRINTRIWPPGDMLPTEVDLAAEFGCARATVNRALRELAGSGVLERRRKAGTRVALNPVRRAVFSISIIRKEIEATGQNYGYSLRLAGAQSATSKVSDLLGLTKGSQAFHVQALHRAGGHPFVYEDRWVNLQTVPSITAADLTKMSANEWLIQNAPFTRGTLSLNARLADGDLAGLLECARGAALIQLERTTWGGSRTITCASLIYHAGYRVQSTI
ncbi:MAG: GntR family transcriptional regulator [Paracoccaceae bacterium]